MQLPQTCPVASEAMQICLFRFAPRDSRVSRDFAAGFSWHMRLSVPRKRLLAHLEEGRGKKKSDGTMNSSAAVQPVESRKLAESLIHFTLDHPRAGEAGTSNERINAR